MLNETSPYYLANQPVADFDYPNHGKSILAFTVPAPASGDLSTLVVMEPVSGKRLPDEDARQLKAF